MARSTDQLMHNVPHLLCLSDVTQDEQQADAINDAMVEAMTQRRRERQERRQAVQTARVERRRVCAYCFQPGDHGSPADCLRALER